MLSTLPKVIIFDFDGVILDSAEIKLRAYAALYAGEDPEKIQVLLRHSRLHGGITRRPKIEYYERTLFGRSGDVETVEALAHRYSEIVYQAVLDCPFVEGAEALLAKASAAGVRMHVVSGTPELELRQIIADRNLSRFFRSICGAPATKPDSFREIVALERCDRAELLAVGGSLTEYLAARSADIPFLGIVPRCNALRRENSGRWSGDMFDGQGFLGGMRAAGEDPEGLAVMLIGAGGAGSAIADALAEAGAKSMVIYDCVEEIARGLAARVAKAHPVCHAQVGSPTIQGIDVLINATPVGMAPDDGLPVELGSFRRDLFVADIVPKLGVTPLLARAQDSGCKTMGGQAMVASQADAVLRFFRISS